MNLLAPDNGTGSPPAAPAEPTTVPWWQPALDGVTGWVADVPPMFWIAALVLTIGIAITAIPGARRHMRRAGEARLASQAPSVPVPTDPEEARKLAEEQRVAALEAKRDKQMFIAAFVPATLFWIAVMVGSARSLAAFGRDSLHWTGGWEWLVPLTLDGVAISFGILAFRALRRGHNPDRATRIAMASTFASAAINFLHEIGLPNGAVLGAGYLALLSVMAMAIFHEFLAQFEDGAGAVARDNPKFGIRWATWPSNTFFAWIAWRNYPPAPGTAATVANSVAHLDHVRSVKAERRAATGAPWWAGILPWIWVRALNSTIAEQRRQITEHVRSVEAERALVEKLSTELETLTAERSAELERLAAERSSGTEHTATLTEQLARITAERDTEHTGRTDAERSAATLRSTIAELTERHSIELAEQAGALRTEHAEHLAAVRAEHAEQLARIAAKTDRSNGAPTGKSSEKTTRSNPAPNRTGAARLTDAEAVELMLREHPEQSYEWGSREVHRLTGAGFGRIPKLIAAVAEHHAGAAQTTPAAERSESRSDDTEERAS